MDALEFVYSLLPNFLYSKIMGNRVSRCLRVSDGKLTVGVGVLSRSFAKVVVYSCVPLRGDLTALRAWHGGVPVVFIIELLTKSEEHRPQPQNHPAVLR